MPVSHSVKEWSKWQALDAVWIPTQCVVSHTLEPEIGSAGAGCGIRGFDVVAHGGARRCACQVARLQYRGNQSGNLGQTLDLAKVRRSSWITHKL